jgi:hypothetical protein
MLVCQRRLSAIEAHLLSCDLCREPCNELQDGVDLVRATLKRQIRRNRGQKISVSSCRKPNCPGEARLALEIEQTSAL